MQKAVFRVTIVRMEGDGSKRNLDACVTSLDSISLLAKEGGSCPDHPLLPHTFTHDTRASSRAETASSRSGGHPILLHQNHLSPAHTEPFFLSLFCPPCQEEEVFWPFSIWGLLPLPSKPHAIVNGHTQEPDNDDDDGTN